MHSFIIASLMKPKYANGMIFDALNEVVDKNKFFNESDGTEEF